MQIKIFKRREMAKVPLADIYRANLELAKLKIMNTELKKQLEKWQTH